MSAESVLVTGANGHLGFRVLVSALKAGYSVRGTVRRPEAAALISKAISIQPYRSQLEIVVVENILEDGAFDNALEGMDFVLHVASPVSRPSEDYINDFINPAVQGTLGLLRSASTRPSVKKIVITSSMAVLDIEKPDRILAQNLGSVPALENLPNAFAAYTASKRIALFKTKQFIEENRPNFDVIHVLPSVILGRNELTSDFASGTNRYVINICLGLDSPAPMLGASVFVNDCADIHVLALQKQVTGSQNLIASGGPVVWSNVNEIVREGFGTAVQEGKLILGGRMDTKAIDLDTNETQNLLGIKWTPFEVQVRSIVGHYLEVVKDRKLIH